MPAPDDDYNTTGEGDSEPVFDARIERFVEVEMADDLPISFEELELVETYMSDVISKIARPNESPASKE